MFSLNCNGKLIIAEKPFVMGILNFTHDSFYSGSRLENENQVFKQARQMVKEGADILDIGAQSTKPGSKSVSAKQELKKIKSVLTFLRKEYPDTLLSVDTYYSEVAGAAVEMGADIINDISGGTMDTNMISTVGNLNVPYVCMHIKGTPENMQSHTGYEDLIKELLEYFIVKIEACVNAGIKDVIIDPGFGFAKNVDQNFKLLKQLSLFKILEKPLLAGLSRKSSIYKTLNISAEKALNGTTVLNTIALQNGADILRVHDVKEAVQAIQLTEKIKTI